ncbi:MAG: hypothetical protein QOG75_7284 [Mycobacterium sp.]|jgi:hypothetical protein|nr:hypothetical protein [Mycobacterium sp.]
MTTTIELPDVRDFVRWPAMERLRLLMERVKMVDLTSQEVLTLAACGGEFEVEPAVVGAELVECEFELEPAVVGAELVEFGDE